MSLHILPGNQHRGCVLELGLKPSSVVSQGHTVELCPAPWSPNYCFSLAFFSKMLDWMGSFLDPRLTHWMALYHGVGEVELHHGVGGCRRLQVAQGPRSQPYPSSRASSWLSQPCHQIFLSPNFGVFDISLRVEGLAFANLPGI